MKKIRLISTGLVFFILLFLGFNASSQEITIQVSPNVLNLNNAGEWVTIHTDIDYDSVAKASVTLNEVPISWSKSDNQGNFVAKFVIGDIKDLFRNETLPGVFTLTLEGMTLDENTFIGAQEIKVVNIIPSGK